MSSFSYATFLLTVWTLTAALGAVVCLANAELKLPQRKFFARCLLPTLRPCLPIHDQFKLKVESLGGNDWAGTCCLNTVYITENIKNVRRALLPNIMKSKSDWNEPKVKKECSRKNNGQGVNGLNAWNIFVSSHFAGQAHFFNTPSALIRTLEPNDKIE